MPHHITETACKDSDQDGRYRPTLAPFALGAARLDGLNQGAAENDDVLMGGDIYSFSLSAGASLRHSRQHQPSPLTR